MSRRTILLPALLVLTLSLGACNRTNPNCPTCPGGDAQTLTVTLCSANVPVTETSDGTLNCTPINLTLPSD
jgi:hypothetical protein